MAQSSEDSERLVESAGSSSAIRIVRGEQMETARRRRNDAAVKAALLKRMHDRDRAALALEAEELQS
jgi:hypothetical protein